MDIHNLTENTNFESFCLCTYMYRTEYESLMSLEISIYAIAAMHSLQLSATQALSRCIQLGYCALLCISPLPTAVTDSCSIQVPPTIRPRFGVNRLRQHKLQLISWWALIGNNPQLFFFTLPVLYSTRRRKNGTASCSLVVADTQLSPWKFRHLLHRAFCNAHTEQYEIVVYINERESESSPL